MLFSFITKTSSVNKAKYSFYTLIIFSVLWTIFVPKPFKNYSPIFFWITFGLLNFLRFNGIMDFSNSFRYKNPKLFKKHKTRHDFVDIDALFKSKDWNFLDADIKLKIELFRYYYTLLGVSFAMGILLGVAVFYLK